MPDRNPTGLPSRFLEKKFVKDEKGDDITPFDGTV
jgi:hypothetical protein